MAIVGAVHCGPDPDAGMAALQPLRELGTPLFDMSQPMPYAAVQSAFDPFFPRQALRAYWKSQYLDELTDDAIDAIAARAADRPGPMTLVNTFRLGGAVHAVGPEDTAFAERSAPFMVSFDTMWSDPAQDDAARSPGAAQRLGRDDQVRQRGRLPELHRPADEPLQAGVGRPPSGATCARLGRIKASYDPDNLFRLNNNVPPAP